MEGGGGVGVGDEGVRGRGGARKVCGAESVGRGKPRGKPCGKPCGTRGHGARTQPVHLYTLDPCHCVHPS